MEAEERNLVAWTEEDQEYAERCAKTDVNNLNGEYARLPADLYYWRGRWVDTLVAEGDTEASRKGAQEDVKTAQAQVYQRLRVLKDQGSKALTESAIEAAIQTSPEYLVALGRFREVAKAERLAGEAKARVAAVVEAIKSKETMLVSLGASMRHEVEMGLRERPRG